MAEVDTEEEHINFDTDKQIQLDDLTLDNEEFSASLNVGEYISMVTEVIDKLTHYE